MYGWMNSRIRVYLVSINLICINLFCFPFLLSIFELLNLLNMLNIRCLWFEKGLQNMLVGKLNIEYLFQEKIYDWICSFHFDYFISVNIIITHILWKIWKLHINISSPEPSVRILYVTNQNKKKDSVIIFCSKSAVYILMKIREQIFYFTHILIIPKSAHLFLMIQFLSSVYRVHLVPTNYLNFCYKA